MIERGAAAPLFTNKKPKQNQPFQRFTITANINSSDNIVMVEVRRIELLSENKSTQKSTGIGCVLHSLLSFRTDHGSIIGSL